MRKLFLLLLLSQTALANLPDLTQTITVRMKPSDCLSGATGVPVTYSPPVAGYNTVTTDWTTIYVADVKTTNESVFEGSGEYEIYNFAVQAHFPLSIAPTAFWSNDSTLYRWGFDFKVDPFRSLTLKKTKRFEYHDTAHMESAQLVGNVVTFHCIPGDVELHQDYDGTLFYRSWTSYSTINYTWQQL